MTNKIKTESESLLIARITAKYIDPMTDFGFKKLFGEYGDSYCSMKFLKTLLKYKGTMGHLIYLSDGDDPVVSSYYGIVNGKDIIVQIKKVSEDCFNDDKNAFFASFHTTYKKGKKSSKYYDAPIIYSVGILDFVFSEDEGDDKYLYVHNVDVSGDEDKKEFYDKTTFVYLVLPKFNKKMNESKTILDKWIYVLKNIVQFKERPSKFDGVFEIFLKHSEIEKLNPEDKIAYKESLIQN
ncbi:MAG: Rpn family recombination-promoting nuclease/putative transposase [Prevotellaceae bacterium]|jgi:hypothetical protein|nr:Rpn family recombination-promoting nuclease/putative transposase [Prevotellaceae bacterium]